jgi:AcrR family transcriptional regulator
MARGYRGMTPEERLADRRERLLLAAYTEFADPGFSETTIERLCAVARISNRAFYECFTGRQELMRAVFERCVDDTTAAVVQAMRAAPDTLDAQVEAGVRAYVRFVTADRRRARIMTLEVRRADDRVNAFRRQKLAVLAQMMEKALSEFPDGAPDNVRMLVLGVLGALQELLADYLASPKPEHLDEVIRTGAHMFRASLTAR